MVIFSKAEIFRLLCKAFSLNSLSLLLSPILPYLFTSLTLSFCIEGHSNFPLRQIKNKKHLHSDELFKVLPMWALQSTYRKEQYTESDFRNLSVKRFLSATYNLFRIRYHSATQCNWLGLYNASIELHYKRWMVCIYYVTYSLANVLLVFSIHVFPSLFINLWIHMFILLMIPSH